MKSMRIAVVCHNYPPHSGGLEVVVRSVATRLGRTNEVTVLTSAWKDRTGRSEEDGIVVHRLPSVHVTERAGVPYPVPWGPGFRQVAREIGVPDLFHVHGSLYLHSLWAARQSRQYRVPLVVTEHVGFVQYDLEPLNAIQRAAWSSAGRYVGNTANAFTVLNGRVQDMLAARWPGKPIELIRNGVDLQTFHPREPAEVGALRRELGLPAEETLVLFAGREVGKKNLHEVLRFRRRGFRLIVCGAPRTLREPDVIDLGVLPHDRMPLLIGAVDIMIQASTGEGFPVALQEAMASGVAAAVLWDDAYAANLDAHVVEAAHSFADLEAAVARLVDDSAHRHAVALAGRRWAVDAWSWAASTDRYAALFSRIVQEHHGSAIPDQEARHGPD